MDTSQGASMSYPCSCAFTRATASAGGTRLGVHDAMITIGSLAMAAEGVACGGVVGLAVKGGEVAVKGGEGGGMLNVLAPFCVRACGCGCLGVCVGWPASGMCGMVVWFEVGFAFGTSTV